ncbi:uncharacterized protein L3040_001944 [Drepanopeziza brunnea f. sp. 'multigermtubi']|uniref:uncharacterized protein n=1 Tax=Drepanopeziza brunnea f. sp. 'multigermtubi' TaxID=698441 RepID=UPI00239A713B|nr:hypothetical protein L3040_001944 [Drepanopeziza brunnea f. sp. 'multigermtubi']
MRFLALLTVALRASAMLDVLAREAGLLYFGTATDNGELNNTKYVKILRNQKEWGQLTSSNGMKRKDETTPCIEKMTDCFRETVVCNRTRAGRLQL